MANAHDLLMAQRAAIMGKVLPYDEELEYLESNGNQYIDTLYKPHTANTRVICDVEFLSSSVINSGVLGCRSDASDFSNAFNLFYSVGNYSIRIDMLRSNTNNVGITGNVNIGINRFECLNPNASYGNLTAYNTGKTGVRSKYNFYLFTFNEKDAPYFPSANLRISKCILSEDGIEFFNSKAVLKNGIPCMYDSVSNGFFYNIFEGHQFGYRRKNGQIINPV